MFATIKNAIESYSSHLKHSLYKISVLERRQVNERMLDADYKKTLGYALREAKIKEIKRGLLGLAKASRDHAPIQNKAIHITINNDGTTETERYIDDTPDQEYDYCAFYLGNDRYGRFGGWGWLAVADLTEYDDDYRNAVNDLDAGDFDASQAADIIHKGINKGDLLIAKSHNPIEAMRLLCEKLDAR